MLIWVMNYIINERGRLRITGSSSGNESGNIVKTELTDVVYSADNGTLGNVKFNSGVKALDVIDYIDYGYDGYASVVSTFKDGNTYSAYVYGTGNPENDPHGFMMVTKGETVTAKARYGVIDKMYYDEETSSYKVDVIDAGETVNTYNYECRDLRDFLIDALCLAYDVNPLNSVSDLTDDKRLPAENRIITYTVYNDDTLRILYSGGSELSVYDGRYDPAAPDSTVCSIGSIRFDDSTKVLDFREYEATGNVSQFGEFQIDKLYTVYACGQTAKGNSAFLMVLDETDIPNLSGYGVIDRIYSGYDGNNYVRITDVDGNKADYVVERGFSFDDSTPVQNRVINYSVEITSDTQGNVTDTLSVIDYVEPTQAQGEYDSDTNSVGNVKLNESSHILDFSKYDEPEKTVDNITRLHKGGNYTLYAYGENNELVLVTDGIERFYADSPLAVVNSVSVGNYQNSSTYIIDAYTDGEQRELIVADDYWIDGVGNLDSGDVILYETNRDGMVTDIMPIHEYAFYNDDYYAYIEELLYMAGQAEPSSAGSAFDTALDDGVPTSATYQTYNGSFFNTKNYSYFTLGPILSAEGGISIGTLAEDGYSYIDAATKYPIADNCCVYTFDSNSRNADEALSVGDVNSIQSSNIADAIQDSGDGGQYIDWDMLDYEDINIALLKIEDGKVAAVYAILPPQ